MKQLINGKPDHIACVAIVAGVSVDEVIRVMNNDQATGKKDIERALEQPNGCIKLGK